MMIIDAHTHLGLVHHKTYSPDDLIQSMDEAGIEYSFVIGERMTVSPDKPSVEDLIAVSKTHPRLKPIGNIDFDTLDQLQIQSLTKHLKDMKIYGLKFYPGYQNYYPDNEKLYPLYELCQRERKPVIFHTGLLAIEYRGLLKQAHPLNIDDVANKFPDLKIIIAHLGNPWIIDCAAVMYKNKNVYADFSALTSEFKPITEHRRQDILNTLSEIRGFMGNLEKCLFGTDYPLYSQKEFLAATTTLGLTPKEKELVFSRNAQQIFGI